MGEKKMGNIRVEVKCVFCCVCLRACSYTFYKQYLSMLNIASLSIEIGVKPTTLR